MFRSLIACLVAVLLWLPSAAATRVDNARESEISQASAATLALPGIPVRLAKASNADGRSPLAREIGHWLVALPENATPLNRAASGGNAPAGNGRASADVLALTFPYYATAPPTTLRG